MKRPAVVLCLLALVVALASSACGNTIRPAAASVNGTDIAQEALESELDAISGNADFLAALKQNGTVITGEGDSTLNLNFVGEVLTSQIFLQLVHAELGRFKLLPAGPGELEAARPDAEAGVGGQAIFEKFPEAYQSTLLRRSAEIAKLRDQLSGAKVDDAAVKAFYDANQALFAQTCVSHILFAFVDAAGQLDQAATAAQADKLKADADAAKAGIAAGADFAAVAREVSVDASNKEAGGDLECGPPGRFVPEFETAMDTLAENQVSDPVQTQFGWHLIKVTGRPVQPIAQAEAQILQRLQADGLEALRSFLRDKLAASVGKITVNPRYGKFSENPDEPRVVPPGAPTTTEPGDPPAGQDGLQDPLTPLGP